MLGAPVEGAFYEAYTVINLRDLGDELADGCRKLEDGVAFIDVALLCRERRTIRVPERITKASQGTRVERKLF